MVPNPTSLYALKPGRLQGQEGTTERPRLAVYRSNNHIYAQVMGLLDLISRLPEPRRKAAVSDPHRHLQVIDDQAGHTLAAVSSLTPAVRETLKSAVGANKEAATLVGQKIAEVCLAKNIEKVFLDRGGLQYHGRIQVCSQICHYT